MKRKGWKDTEIIYRRVFLGAVRALGVIRMADSFVYIKNND